MNWVLLVILFVLGYIIYKGLSSSESPPDPSDGRRGRVTGRGASYTKERERDSLVQSAQRQERLNNYEEASRLYLKAGQVFSAAKMKAMQGPQYAGEAVELIRVNASERSELITRNLANEFFYRLEQPATSAALLRSLGLHDEADAVEVAAGLSTTRTISEPVNTQSSQIMETPEMSGSVTIEPTNGIGNEEPDVSYDDTSDVVAEESIPSVSSSVSTQDSYPNSMMMASSNLTDTCSVCKREIKSGDSFIYCLNCGKPGHYAHLGEMIKVTGKCPICKERLTPTMYDI